MSESGQWQGQLQSRATTGTGIGSHPAVVHDHDFLNDGQPETAAAGSRRKERLKDSFSGRLGNAGAVVVDDNAATERLTIDVPVDGDDRDNSSALTRLDRIPHEVSEHLSEQHFIALHIAVRPVDCQ